MSGDTWEDAYDQVRNTCLQLARARRRPDHLLDEVLAGEDDRYSAEEIENMATAENLYSLQERLTDAVEEAQSYEDDLTAYVDDAEQLHSELVEDYAEMYERLDEHLTAFEEKIERIEAVAEEPEAPLPNA